MALMSTPRIRPDVSIVLPSYNHQQYLSERINSILSQSFQSTELIVLDDCSTDNSLDTIKELLASTPHRLLVSDVNTGSPFSQWDRGVAAARGKYIWIAESDDSSSPYFLSEMISMMEHHKATIGFCESVLIDENGGPLGDTYQYLENLDPYLSRYDFCLPGKSFVLNYLSMQCVMPNASGVIFRRDCYEPGLAERFGLRLSGDWLQWIAIASKGPVVHCHRTLNAFRQHPVTVRSSTRHLVDDEALVCTRFALKQLTDNDRQAFRSQLGTRLRMRWRFAMPISLVCQPFLYLQRARLLSYLSRIPVLAWAAFDCSRLLLKPALRIYLLIKPQQT